MERVAFALVLAGLVACSGAEGSNGAPDRPPSLVVFEGTDAVLHVDLARTPDDRREGLMGVTSLPADGGMAFVFAEPVETQFWMKDTLIPLSIAFVGEDRRVIGLRDMEPCEDDPCPTYGVDEPFVLAIEANLGWFDDHDIRVGETAEIRMGAYG